MSRLALAGKVAFRLTLAVALLGLPEAVLAGANTQCPATDFANQAMEMLNNLLGTFQSSGCAFDSLTSLVSSMYGGW
jgi:hypothetical protein